MYCILIKDNDVYSLYEIGNSPKLYDTKEEAEKEAQEMREKEISLFNNLTTKYDVVEYEE